MGGHFMQMLEMGFFGWGVGTYQENGGVRVREEVLLIKWRGGTSYKMEGGHFGKKGPQTTRVWRREVELCSGVGGCRIVEDGGILIRNYSETVDMERFITGGWNRHYTTKQSKTYWLHGAKSQKYGNAKQNKDSKIQNEIEIHHMLNLVWSLSIFLVPCTT